MRLWHIDMLNALPDLQFKGQLRECVAIMRDWRDKGTTNHLLINRVMEFPKADLCYYFATYAKIYELRYNKKLDKYIEEFEAFRNNQPFPMIPFVGWHNKAYLKVCMANLYEKYYFGMGKSRITQKEWDTLLCNYKILTGEDYEI